MKKPYMIIIFLLGLVVALSMVKAVLQNTLSTSGIFVSKVEQEVNFYKTQNSVLSGEFLNASSLTNITKKAQELGFAGESTLMVLKTSNSLAVKP